jgi:hypothetical protein
VTSSFLAGWDNFYVITGSCAGGLTGLTFVVIALSADAKQINPRGLRVYITPTIVHFGVVLAIAAYLSMPHQGLRSLSLGFGAVGIFGLLYMGFIAANIGRISTVYIPVIEDWLWNVVLPALVYCGFLAIAFLIWSRCAECLYAAAAASVLLMFIGIHNAWDIAAWNSIRKEDAPK